jgi:outer membrane biosynthesis protein TonB
MWKIVSLTFLMTMVWSGSAFGEESKKSHPTKTVISSKKLPGRKYYKYCDKLSDYIWKQWKVPEDPPHMGTQVSATLLPDGSLTDIKVTESSGDAIKMDSSVIAALKKSSKKVSPPAIALPLKLSIYMVVDHNQRLGEVPIVSVQVDE